METETMTAAADAAVTECSGGITAPKGYKASAIACGIRKVRKDLALIISERPAAAAGVFTQNKVAAAPIVLCKKHIAVSGLCSAVIVNSGNANACTGERGDADALAMARGVAEAMNVPAERVLVSSTGVIGQYMPMEKILPRVPELVSMLRPDGSDDAALAIMTTDTFPKEIAASAEIDGVTITVGGIAKGSGMIHPNMATMLGFITTDAAVDQKALQNLLRSVNRRTFNRVSVDGDTSTNDMVLVMANGAAGNAVLTETSPGFARLAALLEYVMTRLAQMIARDGEGASKLVEINVAGAKTEEEAEQAARAIANSNLVKTAIHGADANWGRILCAVGYSGIDFVPEKVEIRLNDVPILLPGYQIVLDEEKAKEVLLKYEVAVNVDLHQGPASARFWTCDLTSKYIDINARYRT